MKEHTERGKGDRMKPRTYRNVIGTNLRQLRQQQGLRQDDLANLGRANGLDWTRATVAAIELGRRSLAGDEEMLLQATLDVPDLHRELRATDGLSEDDEIEIGDGYILTTAEWRSLANGQHVSPGHSGTQAMWPQDYEGDRQASAAFRRQLDLIANRYSVPEDETPRIVAATQNEAEVKAARRLKRDPREVAYASWSVWGHSLTEERDRRLLEEQGEGGTPPRRGHITRQLDRELRKHLREANRRKQEQ